MQNTEKELLDILRRSKEDMFMQAQAIKELCARFGYTQAGLAKTLGVSQSRIGNKARLLQFSAIERDLIHRYNLSERHARSLLRAKPPKREKLIATAGTLHLTAQQTEELVEKHTLPLLPTESELNPSGIDSFEQQIQANAQRLCMLGYSTVCMIESCESWRRITITISEQCST